jgi:hypothetical protein
MKIAFCFLIRDRINHEELWNEFFNNTSRENYSIYIHYKKNTPLKFFEKYKIDKTIKTKWAGISIVKAQNLLLESALRDPENLMFVFLSESCIPLKNFEYIQRFLNTEYSYFNMSPESQCFPKCNKTLKYLDKEFIKKANMMSILNRKHAEEIIKHSKMMLKWFDYRKTVSDEHCYITLLHYLRLETELITTPNTSYSGATTFSPWDDMADYKIFTKSEKSNSYTYKMICADEIDFLLNSKCLFARKFTVGCTVDGRNLSDYIITKIISK